MTTVTLDRPTVARAHRTVKRYYERHPSGGSLHIVLDDNNIKRVHLEHCRDRAVREGDAPGALLARILLRMTISQRRRLTALRY